MKSVRASVASAVGILAISVGQAGAATVKIPSRAADFTWNLGVGVHLGAYGGPYGSLPNVMSALSYLGFRHLRDSVKTTTWDIARVQQLGAAGYKFDYILASPPLAYLSPLHQVAADLEYIEGANEVDVSNFPFEGLIGVPAGIVLQRIIYLQIKSDPILAKIPVLNFTIADWGHTVQAGNMAAYANYGNYHFYPFVGHTPLQELPTSIVDKTDVPGKPLIATETGFSTVAWNAQSATARGAEGCDEKVQAKDLLDDVFDMYHAQNYRIYLYELVDEVYDAANTNLDYHFGLFRTDWSPKPAASAFHNLAAILADGAANKGSFTPSPLTYTLTDTAVSAPIDFTKFSVLLQKANRASDIVVWAEPSLWNAVDHLELPLAATHNVQLVLPATVKSISVYDPMVGTTLATSTIKSVSNVSKIAFNVVDHPVVVEIVP